MKIIDWEKKGNVVRLYLGNDYLEDWGGDDWDDTPYEHNAGRVYDRYVGGVKDIALPFEATVLEPAEDYSFNGNSPFSKDDLKARVTPCIVVVPQECDLEDEYRSTLGYASAFKIYLGDRLDETGRFIVDEASWCRHCELATNTILDRLLCADCKKSKIKKEVK